MARRSRVDGVGRAHAASEATPFEAGGQIRAECPIIRPHYLRSGLDAFADDYAARRHLYG